MACCTLVSCLCLLKKKQSARRRSVGRRRFTVTCKGGGGGGGGHHNSVSVCVAGLIARDRHRGLSHGKSGCVAGACDDGRFGCIYTEEWHALSGPVDPTPPGQRVSWMIHRWIRRDLLTSQRAAPLRLSRAVWIHWGRAPLVHDRRVQRARAEAKELVGPAPLPHRPCAGW
jgi:hypothetical protein